MCKESVLCVCVKGNISRVLFINIHIIYIFCFYLLIFSADQSVTLNVHLINKYTHVYTYDRNSRTYILCIALHVLLVFCEKCIKSVASFFFFNTMSIVAKITHFDLVFDK